MQRTMQVTGGRTWISLGTPSSSGVVASGVPRIMLANQNLLHLVLKCQMSTKHSRARRALQALFRAQRGGRKTTTKTADCGAVSRVSTHLPPRIHRVVHRIASRRTVAPDVAVLRQRERRGARIRRTAAAGERDTESRVRLDLLALCFRSPTRGVLEHEPAKKSSLTLLS
jgi:hypothetical protein